MIHKYRFQAMTVGCELQLVMPEESDARAVAERVIRNTLRLQNKYNFHSADSWLSRQVNQRRAERVALDDESRTVLQQVQALAPRTGGHFDITVGTLRPCFRQRSRAEALKLRKRLEKFMGPSQWQLDGDALIFANELCKFDLGGVIKEHAVDQAAQIVRDAGVSGALINFGGDIYVHGRKSEEIPFTVAVKNPQNPAEMLFGLELENQALTTSGHYERSQTFGKRKISHILGRDGVDSRVQSVTVVSPSVLESGVFSTALTLQPSLELSETMAAVFVDQQLQLHQSYETLEKL